MVLNDPPPLNQTGSLLEAGNESSDQLQKRGLWNVHSQCRREVHSSLCWKGASSSKAQESNFEGPSRQNLKLSAIGWNASASATFKGAIEFLDT